MLYVRARSGFASEDGGAVRSLRTSRLSAARDPPSGSSGRVPLRQRVALDPAQVQPVCRCAGWPRRTPDDGAIASALSSTSFRKGGARARRAPRPSARGMMARSRKPQRPGRNPGAASGRSAPGAGPAAAPGAARGDAYDLSRAAHRYPGGRRSDVIGLSFGHRAGTARLAWSSVDARSALRSLDRRQDPRRRFATTTAALRARTSVLANAVTSLKSRRDRDSCARCGRTSGTSRPTQRPGAPDGRGDRRADGARIWLATRGVFRRRRRRSQPAAENRERSRDARPAPSPGAHGEVHRPSIAVSVRGTFDRVRRMPRGHEDRAGRANRPARRRASIIVVLIDCAAARRRRIYAASLIHRLGPFLSGCRPLRLAVAAAPSGRDQGRGPSPRWLPNGADHDAKEDCLARPITQTRRTASRRRTALRGGRRCRAARAQLTRFARRGGVTDVPCISPYAPRSARSATSSTVR